MLDKYTLKRTEWILNCMLKLLNFPNSALHIYMYSLSVQCSMQYSNCEGLGRLKREADGRGHDSMYTTHNIFNYKMKIKKY